MDLKELRSDYKNVRGIEKDVDVVAFNIAANGSLAKFDLVDQAIDAFEDTSGVNDGASNQQGHDTTGKYVVGKVAATVGFTSTGATTWTCPAPVTSAEILVVAGGGGGCGGYGGGGGAGGVVHHATYPTVAGVVYDLTVGAGAPGRPVNTGVNGDNSSFNNNNEGSQSKMTAIGGGGSTYYYGPGGQDPGNDGGSGGGGAYYGRPGGDATQGDSGGGTGYGNDGGDGTNTNTDEGGSGGGGAGGAGSSCGSDDLGGPGGAGREFANFGSYGTDSSNSSGATPGSGSGKGYFGGGGGGSAVKGSGAAGGVGGGAQGIQTTSGTAPHGFPNTGGGGGGARGEGGSGTGGNGGSGIVLIKYEAAGLDMTLIGNTITAQSQPTTGDLLIAYTNGAGTATLNTDIKGFVSRDATNYTEGTLVSQGTTAGQLLASFNNLNISGQPAGTSMRYKITTHNQSGSKETRVHGAALGWS